MLQQEVTVSKLAYPLFPNVNSAFALYLEHEDNLEISVPRWLQ